MKEKVTNNSIYNALLLGINQVKANKNHLNEMNFFPVPDNDTGENLSHLMQRIEREIVKEESIKDILKTVSDSAIKGARGNSGAIFSQFFQGFLEKCPDRTSLQMEELVACFESGTEYAYNALENPVEGTIITAMKNFSQVLAYYSEQEVSIAVILDESYKKLQKNVENTKFILYKNAKVKKEDAGALGFMYFIKGFIEGLKGMEYQNSNTEYLDILKETRLNTRDYHLKDKFKYCTEVLQKNNNDIQKNDLKKCLKKYGDSIVITENNSFRRTHIHSNNPQKIIQTLSLHGEILEVKADDMLMQQRLTKEPESEIGLVIDSIADLPIENLPDFVYMLPLNIIINGVSYQDKRTAPKNLVNLKDVTSSQPNISEINDFLVPIIKRHKHILILTVSSKMSGLYERYLEFKTNEPELSIEIVDTKLNSVAEGLIAYQAINKIKEGLDFNQLIEYIESSIERTFIIVSLKNLQGMIKSGRLNQKIGCVLQKIGFLPLVTIDKEGNGTIKKPTFSQKKNYANLLNEVEKNIDKIDSYALVHVNNPEKVKELANYLTKKIGFPPVYVSDISSIVEIFSGEGSIAIGYQLKENYG